MEFTDIKNEVIFNGVSTKDIGVFIQTTPTYEFPEREYDVMHVEGRSGDMVFDKESYRNVGRTYYLGAEILTSSSFIETVQKIVKWLTSAKGYSRLEDTFEPDYYRKALYRSGGNLSNMYDKATALPITFECKPQRYLKSGETPVVITEANKGQWVEIVNPTDQIALPEITINGENLLVEFVSGEVVTSPDNESSMTNNFIGEGKVDSELQDCYNDSVYLNNDVVLVNGFPKLYPGKNFIRITGTSTINTFSIKPNWWTI